MFDHVLCDFDGTLVDSSNGILETLRSCLVSASKRSSVELTKRLIGPPLRTLIEVATGLSDVSSLAQIEMAFCREYDERGYLATRPYPSIAEALTELRAHAVGLHIVTNKRLIPTVRILEMLGWTDTFSTVNTLDSNAVGTTKARVVGQLLLRLRVQPSSVALVGDSLDDAIAARDNGICYAWASWGYGQEAELGATGVSLGDAKHLTELILRKDMAEVAHGA